MSDTKDINHEMSQLFRQHMETLKKCLAGDSEISPAVLKEAREFLKDNSITKDNLSTVTFDDLTTVIPLDKFEDELGTTAH